jgi:putative transposase
MDVVWEIFSEQLFFVHRAFRVKIRAFVLMSNHFHLLLDTPDANLDHAMEWFMRETSRTLVRAGNRINQTYGGPYFRSVVSTNHYYTNVYKYIYYNPIFAGLCRNVLHYPYSTLPGLLGRRRLLVPVETDLLLFEDISRTLEWLNTKPKASHWVSVRKALKRGEFKLSRLNGRAHPLEFDTL